MDMITAYLVGALVLIGLWAWRVPHEDVRMVFILSIMWPLSVVVILFIVALSAIGWEMELDKGKKAFGFRKPTNPLVKGFALTVLFQEFQFYKARKG